MQVAQSISSHILVRQLLLDLLAPPLAAGLWWVFARAFAWCSEEGCTDRHKYRLKQAFWVALAGLYAVMISMTIYFDVLR